VDKRIKFGSCFDLLAKLKTTQKLCAKLSIANIFGEWGHEPTAYFAFQMSKLKNHQTSIALSHTLVWKLLGYV